MRMTVGLASLAMRIVVGFKYGFLRGEHAREESGLVLCRTRMCPFPCYVLFWGTENRVS